VPAMGEPAKLQVKTKDLAEVEAARRADENTPRGAEMDLEKRNASQACVSLFAEQRGEAEDQDECLTKHEGECNAAAAAAAAAAELEEEPSQEVKIEDSVEPAQQETGKQRRRKKRRERLRQRAKA
jgi:hypothetical protein